MHTNGRPSAIGRRRLGAQGLDVLSGAQQVGRIRRRAPVAADVGPAVLAHKVCRVSLRSPIAQAPASAAHTSTVSLRNCALISGPEKEAC